jgi:hypothetical protein
VEQVQAKEHAGAVEDKEGGDEQLGGHRGRPADRRLESRGRWRTGSVRMRRPPCRLRGSFCQ